MAGRQLYVHPLAEAEIAEAARWYDERSPGLGAIFVAAVRHATEVVLEAPQRWRLIRGARRYLLGAIPFRCRVS